MTRPHTNRPMFLHEWQNTFFRREERERRLFVGNFAIAVCSYSMGGVLGVGEKYRDIGIN